MLDDLRQRLRALFKREAVERELDEELRFHFNRQVEKYTQAGQSRGEAMRRARLDFGGLDQVKEEYRDSLGIRLLADRRRDAMLAVRALRRQPGFASVAVLTLALGIGATTAVFSVVYGVLLKPLPFPAPDRLVALYHVTPATPTDFQGDATYFTYRAQGRVFEDIGLWMVGDVSANRNGGPDQISALNVTDGTLSLLAVRAELGRLIRKEDDVPGAPLRVVLTHAYWRQAFGSSTDVIGRSLVINARPHEIIGVLPASFRLLNTDPQVVLPMRLDPANARTGPLSLNGMARLKPGVTLAQANDDIARMIPLVAKQFPLMPGLTQEVWDSVGLAPNVRPLSESLIGKMSRPLWILLGTVGIVLVMAWTNVANLLLVRAEGRQREFAVRAALGASRGRIVAELLSESLVLGLAGGALGVLFAVAGVGLLRTMAPVALPRVSDIGVEGVVLLFTLIVSVLTALIFGLLPAARLGTLNFPALKEAGRSVTDGPGRHRTRNALVVAQVALALVLLVVSGLMGRTFIALRQIDPGFVRPAEVQMFEVALPAALIRDRQQVAQTYEQIVERLKQLPGVTAVGLGAIRMDGMAGKAPIYVEGRSVTGMPPVRFTRSIGAGYFETMGNPVIAGRTIGWTDIHQRRPVVLISENLAREYWDAPANAVGHRIGMFPEGPWLEIAGVVGNVRASGLSLPAPGMVYFPFANEQSVSRNLTFAVRSDRAGTPGLLRELQRAVWSVNANPPLGGVRTLDEIQSRSMAQTTFAMVMLGLAASVALLLGIVGIYGVIRYVAVQRTREIGIRIALGAQIGDVRRLFLRHGLGLTLVGIAIGIGAAGLLTRVMSALLFGVGPTDPATYVVASLALAAVAALATYLPARRASAVDPALVLRSDA